MAPPITIPTSSVLAYDLPYIAPETSAQQDNGTARDMWSFGFVICEVLVPDFVGQLVREHPGILNLASPEKVAENNKGMAGFAENILDSSDSILKDVAIKCLSLEPKSRPRIEDACRAPPIPFHELFEFGLERAGSEQFRW